MVFTFIFILLRFPFFHAFTSHFFLFKNVYTMLVHRCMVNKKRCFSPWIGIPIGKATTLKKAMRRCIYLLGGVETIHTPTSLTFKVGLKPLFLNIITHVIRKFLTSFTTISLGVYFLFFRRYIYNSYGSHSFVE